MSPVSIAHVVWSMFVGRKIHAIKLVRLHGLDSCTTLFGQEFIVAAMHVDECNRLHTGHGYEYGSTTKYGRLHDDGTVCDYGLGLKDAKDLCEGVYNVFMRFFTAAQAEQKASILDGMKKDFRASYEKWLAEDANHISDENKALHAALERTGDKALELRRLANDTAVLLRDEQAAARTNERRLGQALSQVAGLRTKLEDRSDDLRSQAVQNRMLRTRIATLERVIANQAIDQDIANTYLD